MKRKMFSPIFIAIAMLMLAPVGFAQEKPAQEPPRPRRSTPPTHEESEPPADEAQANLQRTLAQLSRQIEELTSELRMLRADNQRMAAAIELMLYESRLERLEDKVTETENERFTLEQRFQELQLRLRNVPQEAALRGGRRDEVENALRTQYQNAINQTNEQLGLTQKRLFELQGQADQLRARIELLRRRFDPPKEEEK